MHMMEHSEQIAIQFFRRIGFTAEPISVSVNSRADIRVYDGETEYIVEVKEKIDDPAILESQLSSVDVDGIQLQIRTSQLSRSNRLDGIFKGGSKQLKETPSKDNAYHLLWVHCGGIDAGLQEVQLRNTFYGIVPVAPNDREAGCMCFYFDFNTAYMLRHVHGLLIASENGLRLYINEFAVNAERFRSSQLTFKMKDCIFDPIVILENEKHIAFRGDISRKDENAVLLALEKQTGVRYRTVRMKRYSF